MTSWKIKYELSVEKDLKRDFANGKISREDIAVLKIWAKEVEEHGPEFIQRSKLWNDHALEKEWSGCRSSCFSLKGRIIYRVEDKEIVVKVVRITSTHDYQRRREDEK